MIRMRTGPSRRRGFALILVIGVMTVVLILLVAAQGAAQYTRMDNSRSSVLDDRAEAAASILTEIVAAGPDVPTGDAQRSTWNEHTAFSYSVRPRPQNTAVGADAFPFLEGDAIVTIRWDMHRVVPAATERYLVNRLGARSSAIYLGRSIANADAPTTTSTQTDVEDPT